MNIIHFCESIELGGGIASFVANLSQEQVKDHDVTICSIAESTNDIALDSRVSLYKLNKIRAGFSIKYPLKIFRYLRKTHFDVVHIHSAFLYYALAVILLHRHVTFVYTIHSDAQRENSSRWDKYFFWLKKWCFKQQWVHPITISQASKDSFYNTYGVDSCLIFNGIRQTVFQPGLVDISKYKQTASSRIFIHPGRISEAKNQVTLCRAFTRLIEEGADVILLIAGTIQDNFIFNEMRKYFSNRIIYIGQRRDVLELLHESDAMCLSSIWEGLPIVLLESMSVGCIPICTPVGGIVDVVKDGYNGILSLTTDVDGYYMAIKRFLELSPTDIISIKKACEHEFTRYSISQTSMRYISYYEALKVKKLSN